MATKKRETATTKWEIRITPRVDREAREMAEARGLNLSAYLRYLVQEDRVRMAMALGVNLKLKK